MQLDELDKQLLEQLLTKAELFGSQFIWWKLSIKL